MAYYEVLIGRFKVSMPRASPFPYLLRRKSKGQKCKPFFRFKEKKGALVLFPPVLLVSHVARWDVSSGIDRGETKRRARAMSPGSYQRERYAQCSSWGGVSLQGHRRVREIRRCVHKVMSVACRVPSRLLLCCNCYSYWPRGHPFLRGFEVSLLLRSDDGPQQSNIDSRTTGGDRQPQHGK